MVSGKVYCGELILATLKVVRNEGCGLSRTHPVGLIGMFSYEVKGSSRFKELHVESGQEEGG